MIGVLFGFFVFNYKLVKVFMGDVGLFVLGVMLVVILIVLC